MAGYSDTFHQHSSPYEIDSSRRARGQLQARLTTLRANGSDLMYGIAR